MLRPRFLPRPGERRISPQVLVAASLLGVGLAPVAFVSCFRPQNCEAPDWRPAATRRGMLFAVISWPDEASAQLAQGSNALTCIRERAMEEASRDPRLAAGLLRLAFHDAATSSAGVGGPNGSVRFELARSENVGPTLLAALRAVEGFVRRCRVGWADAIAVSGAIAVEASGGPRIDVPLGRADASAPDPDGLLPEAGFNSTDIRSYFQKRGLSDEEAVALCGAHTIGRWTSFIGVTKACMALSGDAFWKCTREQGTRLPFTDHPERFDNEYFQAVAEAYRRRSLPPPKGKWKDRAQYALKPLYLLPSDNSLMYDDDLQAVVLRFAADKQAFFAAFAAGYRKLVQ